MTTATLSKAELNGIDFDALANAQVKPDNKKQAIIDHISYNDLPNHAPDLALFQNNGVVIKDDFASYLGNKDFYSTGSFAKLANGTPLDFKYDISEGVKNELEKYKDRSSFDLGTFVHECILEPEKWETVICEPKASRTSHEGLDTLITFWGEQLTDDQICQIDGDGYVQGAKTDSKKAWIQSAINISGKRSIDDKNATIVKAIHSRWKEYQNGLWSAIMAAAHKEVSIYCNDFMGLPMRVRPDGLLFAEQIGVNAIVSVKTTAATSMGQYARDFRKYGYDLKESAYQRIVSQVMGIDFSTTIMIVLSTAEPFNMGVFILNDTEMEAAFQSFATAVDHAKFCIQANDFPGWEIKAGAGDMGLIDLNVY